MTFLRCTIKLLEKWGDVMDHVIQRINELYRKSKAVGLTNEEKNEQDELRRQYIDAFKNNLRGQLDSIRYVEDEENQ